ncbi:MAG: Ig-like domain-containing protein [Paludibacteraceae bacterium]|nr:Ig-like domain-containing protein [Paludibacteraceae bacterium]
MKKGEALITKYHVPVEVNQSLFNDANFTTKEGTTSWNNTTGITLGDVNGGGFIYDDKSIILHFDGIPDQLTFDIAIPASVGGGIGTLLGGVTDVEWYVQESETATMPEEKIWNSSYEGTTAQSNAVQLQPSTRYVKICYSGNFGAYVRNIRISERKYLEQPVPQTVDFGSAVINAGEVTKEVYINWCNVRPLTVTSSNPRFTVTPTSFGGLEQIGSQNLTISFMHDNRVGEESAVITITNGEDEYTHTISATAVTTRRPQTIDWNAALVATGFAMNVGETFPNAEIEAIAVAPNLGEVLFSSSNPEIISVSEDGLSLTAVAAGTAEITATQAGDEDYEPVSDTKTFVVT